MKKTPKILIIKPSSLGDIIHALPALSIIRKSFPASYLAWLVSDPFKGLLEGHPYLDEIISFPRHFFLQKGLPFLKELRSRQFDIIIDLQGLLRSALLGFLCRAEERIGFREGREFSPLFYTRPITIGRHILHAVDRNMQLASSISGGIFEVDFTFNLSPRAVKKVEGKLKELKIEGEIIALNPATRWPSKRWKEDNWARLAESLANEGNIFFLAGPGEEGLIEDIRKLMEKNSFSLAGQLSLQELAVFLSRSRLLVTVDSGPMHLAASMHIPLVALFGPTDPARCGPYGHSRSVIKSSLDCSGCYRVHCRSNKCMDDIAPGQVLAKAVEILKKGVR